MSEKYNFVTYCRKSTNEKSKQLHSIESQLRITNDIAKQNDYKITETIIEKKSAKEAYLRPEFNRMIQLITEGKANAILSWTVDRLSRNYEEFGILQSLLHKGILKEIVTTEGTFATTASLLQFGIQSVFSVHDIQKLSTRVKNGMETVRQKGRMPGPAPLGYINKDLQIKIDPTHSPTIKLIFELYQSGEYSTLDITKILKSENLTTRNNKPIYKGLVHKILVNPFYYGDFLSNGKLYTGSHEALISKEVFDKCQQLLTDKRKPRTQKHHNGVFRGKITCAECGCRFTLDVKNKVLITTKKEVEYRYYCCNNSREDYKCQTHPRFNRDTLDLIFQQFLSDIQAPEKMATTSLELYKYKVLNDNQHITKKRKLLENLSSELKENKLSLTKKFSQDLVDQDQYQIATKEYTDQERKYEEQLKKLITPVDDSTFELLEEFKKTATQVSSLYENGNDEVKTEIIKSVLSNCTMNNEKIVSIQYNKPWDMIAKHAKSDDLDVWSSIWDEARTGLHRLI